MKKEKGITLIALIITIIVLLILAGVALNTLFGEGSIIGNAQNAVDEYNKKVEEEIEKRFPNAEKTSTGLRYIITKSGSGNTSPKYGQKVTVHYQGELLNGKVFDSSLIRKQPAVFKIGEVIEGWNEALMTMKKGEKRLLIIPPDLGYGEYGYPGVIPPDSYLIFNVELLDF